MTHSLTKYWPRRKLSPFARACDKSYTLDAKPSCRVINFIIFIKSRSHIHAHRTHTHRAFKYWVTKSSASHGDGPPFGQRNHVPSAKQWIWHDRGPWSTSTIYCHIVHDNKFLIRSESPPELRKINFGVERKASTILPSLWEINWKSLKDAWTGSTWPSSLCRHRRRSICHRALNDWVYAVPCAVSHSPMLTELPVVFDTVLAKSLDSLSTRNIVVQVVWQSPALFRMSVAPTTLVNSPFRFVPF